MVVVSLVALAGFGQYQRLWTYVGQRDYEAVLKAIVVATLVIVGVIALLHPVTHRRRSASSAATCTTTTGAYHRNGPGPAAP